MNRASPELLVKSRATLTPSMQLCGTLNPVKRSFNVSLFYNPFI